MWRMSITTSARLLLALLTTNPISAFDTVHASTSDLTIRQAERSSTFFLQYSKFGRISAEPMVQPDFANESFAATYRMQTG